MRGCELIWDQETADRVQELVVESIGACPCLSHGRCPLLPADFVQRLEKGALAVRSAVK
jgi:hypothetical protein